MNYSEKEQKFKQVLDYIKSKRNDKKITQREFANMLNINSTSYNHYETGLAKLPAFIFIEIISKLDINISEIETIYNKTSKTYQRTIPVTMQPDYLENLQKLCLSQQAMIEKQQAMIDHQLQLIESLELKLKL